MTKKMNTIVKNQKVENNTSKAKTKSNRTSKTTKAVKLSSAKPKVLYKFHDGVTLSVEKYNWKVAQDILANHNEQNRALSDSIVFDYKDSMIANEWQNVGDSIVFDVDGNLVDGQHRLLALVIAHNQGYDIEKEFTTYRNAAKSSYKYKDVGKQRTITDAIDMADKKGDIKCRSDIKASWLSPTIKHAIKILENKYEYRNRDSLAKNVKIYNEQLTGLDDSVHFVFEIAKKQNACSLPPSQIAALHYFFSKKDQQKADEFITQLLMGTNMDEKHVIYQLINAKGRIYLWRSCSDIKIDGKKRGRNRATPYGLIITAWNHVRNNEPHKTMRFPSDYYQNPTIPEII